MGVSLSIRKAKHGGDSSSHKNDISDIVSEINNKNKVKIKKSDGYGNNKTNISSNNKNDISDSTI